MWKKKQQGQKHDLFTPRGVCGEWGNDILKRRRSKWVNPSGLPCWYCSSYCRFQLRNQSRLKNDTTCDSVYHRFPCYSFIMTRRSRCVQHPALPTCFHRLRISLFFSSTRSSFPCLRVAVRNYEPGRIFAQLPLPFHTSIFAKTFSTILPSLDKI